MKTTIQQEILLMVGTSFSSRQCLQKNEDNNQPYLSETEQLGEACCNGLLPMILPEIFESSDGLNELYVWQVRENRLCIEIELGQFPEIIEKNFSIVPYSFFSFQLMN